MKENDGNGLPLILLMNDDGVDAAGIKALQSVAQHFGHVVVVAPARSQSGRSHAITFSSPLRYRKVKESPEAEVYKVYGTPVDAYKIADCEILQTRKPDLLLSGINHGANTSSSLIYSGTMATVIEGCINGIPSIGFSLVDNGKNPDFEAAKMYIYSIIYRVMRERMPERQHSGSSGGGDCGCPGYTPGPEPLARDAGETHRSAGTGLFLALREPWGRGQGGGHRCLGGGARLYFHPAGAGGHDRLPLYGDNQ